MPNKIVVVFFKDTGDVHAVFGPFANDEEADFFADNFLADGDGSFRVLIDVLTSPSVLQEV